MTTWSRWRPLIPNLTVEDLIREFELTPHSAYIQRAQKAQNAQRPAGPGKTPKVSQEIVEGSIQQGSATQDERPGPRRGRPVAGAGPGDVFRGLGDQT